MDYKIKLIVLYAMMFFGGLWQILGLFTELSRIASGPILIIVSIFSMYEILTEIAKKSMSKTSTKNYLLYFTFVITTGFVIELVGVRTGVIFGVYKYGTILQPQFLGVPIAIGFAWFTSLISSTAIIQRFSKINHQLIGSISKSFITGFLMMLFDIFLEPAATELSYWNWQIGIAPAQNYISWFVFGTIFSYIGFRFKLLNLNLPKVIYHLYFAQILFFAMVYLK